MPDKPASSSTARVLAKLLRWHNEPHRWSVAAVAFLAAFALRYALADDLPHGFPFLTFFPAVILTAFLCGLGPGIAVALASTIASWFFFIPPSGGFNLDGPTALALGFFVVIAAVDLTVIHYMFRWLHELDEERDRSRQLAASRDLMFKEMQHRVSNNLLVVSSLLRLQRRSVADASAQQALDEAASRIALVSKIHRQLHDPAGQQLPFGTFLKDLCHDILEASGTSGDVVCLVQADELFLDAERAVPVALIVAELVSNALEHAFAERGNGTIAIDLRRQPGADTTLTIQDDGVGLPDGFDLEATRSLGLLVARRLAGQIQGVLSITPSPAGTMAALRFPL